MKESVTAILTFEDQIKAISKGVEILNEDKVKYKKRREVLLSEKESLTDFMLKNLL